MKECGVCEACCQERDGDEWIDRVSGICGYCQDIIDINDDPDQLIGIGRYLQSMYKNAMAASKIR